MVELLKKLVKTITISSLGEVSVSPDIKLLGNYPSTTSNVKRIVSIITKTFYIFCILRNYFKKTFYT